MLEEEDSTSEDFRIEDASGAEDEPDTIKKTKWCVYFGFEIK